MKRDSLDSLRKVRIGSIDRVEGISKVTSRCVFDESVTVPVLDQLLSVTRFSFSPPNLPSDVKLLLGRFCRPFIAQVGDRNRLLCYRRQLVGAEGTDCIRLGWMRELVARCSEVDKSRESRGLEESWHGGRW